jgi:hypothetical protein
MFLLLKRLLTFFPVPPHPKAKSRAQLSPSSRRPDVLWEPLLDVAVRTVLLLRRKSTEAKKKEYAAPRIL